MKIQLARWMMIGALLLTLVAAAPGTSQAGPYKYIVGGTTDPEASACTFSGAYSAYVCPSLRSAVIAANANPGSTIQLAHGATYSLEYPPVAGDDAWSGDLNFTADTHVNFGNVICPANCRATIQGGLGWHDRLVTIENGAIVQFANIVFRGGNRLSGDGGGIAIAGSSYLILGYSVVTGNKAAGAGGGIAIQDPSGNLYMNDSVVSFNEAGYGGGIGSGGSTVILSSAIVSNTAAQAGGYDAYGAGRNVLINTTLSGNTATWQIGAFEAMNGVSVYLYSVTIANNESPGDTGGLQSVPNAHIADSVLAGNTMNHLPARDCAGQIASGGYNVIGNAEGCVISVGSGDRFGGSGQGIDALLGALQSVQGTFAHVPRRGSPLIDAGNPAGCPDDWGTLLTTDQLGDPRPQTPGGRCDIGAVEHVPFPTLYLPLMIR